MCFSRNVKQLDQDALSGLLGVIQFDRHEKYLGFPTLGWKGRLLSAAEKEILIKVIGQAIVVYAMLCFLIPRYFCDNLCKMVARFSWNRAYNSKMIHWLSWDKLCASKHEGGLGFWNMYTFNLGLLAKQGWRLICDPSSLVAKTLKAKYFSNVSFLEAKVNSNASSC